MPNGWGMCQWAILQCAEQGGVLLIFKVMFHRMLFLLLQAHGCIVLPFRSQRADDESCAVTRCAAAVPALLERRALFEMAGKLRHFHVESGL